MSAVGNIGIDACIGQLDTVIATGDRAIVCDCADNGTARDEYAGIVAGNQAAVGDAAYAAAEQPLHCIGRIDITAHPGEGAAAAHRTADRARESRVYAAYCSDDLNTIAAAGDGAMSIIGDRANNRATGNCQTRNCCT